jgi:SAM-dependent methyltransferase
MAILPVAARAAQQRAVSARVDVASGCPICGTAQFLYDFTVGRRRLSQCAGCGLARLDTKPNADAAASPASLDKGHVSARGPLAPPARDLLTYAMKTYGGTANGAARRVVLLGEGEDATGLNGVDAQSVSLKQLVSGDVPAELPDASFDAVVIGQPIETVAEPSECLREAKHLLRPGGLLVLRAEHLNYDHAGADRSVLGDEAVSFLYGFDQIRSLLFAAGFGEIHIHPVKQASVRPQSYARTLEGSVAVVARPRARAVEVSGHQSLSIIMPVFNEKSTFAKAFDLVYAKRLEGVEKEIIVVESNSTDGTRDDVLAIQDRPGVRVLLQDRPQGKGFAVRAGLDMAKGDFVIIQDADLEYDIEDYDLLLEPLVSNRAAFVLGARHGELGGWKMRRFNDQPLLSTILNSAHLFFTGMFNVVYGTRVRDPFTMYKLFRRDCITGLTFEANRFDFDWEIMAKIVRRGYRPVEIPVNYVSRSFTEGKKVSFFRDPLTWIRACIKFRFVRIP